ncbi:hypothetical protein Rrhod_3607 [Rhodococcus rhodnii LMG 5362]|uniref:Uncharacterized protein n=1 Tax=Rhodococcus rhodnii LMG 5362 TaxID=1273125 RepID=R7WIQ3_9NOCA|nr:hypothetical protein Rrhod_3607 [Rhodococcus rhodnii LMG 5362]
MRSDPDAERAREPDAERDGREDTLSEVLTVRSSTTLATSDNR